MGIFNKLNMQFIKLFYVLAYGWMGLALISFIITKIMMPESQIIPLFISNIFLLGAVLYLYAENKVNKLNLNKLNYKVFPKNQNVNKK